MARQFMRDSLRCWKLGDLGFIGSVNLLTTELVANAVVHARSAVDLVALHLGDSVRVEVHDAADAAPTMRDQADDAISGRGLGLFNSMASRWGTDRAGDKGKVVWFELEVPDSD